jgi:hypothetical protein
VRWFWLAVLGVSVAPVVVLSIFLNPLVVWHLGPEAWWARVARVRPFGWWLVAAAAAFAISSYVLAAQYG